MFRKHIWEIIHNRFSAAQTVTEQYAETGYLQWGDGMTAGDWWKASRQGDPDAEDEGIVNAGPIARWFQAFMVKLHHAYAGNSDFFDDHDERMWYDEWILPFDDPLNHPEVMEAADVWTTNPKQFFNNLRFYMETEAPAALFNHHTMTINWDWTPTKRKYHNAINKELI